MSRCANVCELLGGRWVRFNAEQRGTEFVQNVCELFDGRLVLFNAKQPGIEFALAFRCLRCLCFFVPAAITCDMLLCWCVLYTLLGGRWVLFNAEPRGTEFATATRCLHYVSSLNAFPYVTN